MKKILVLGAVFVLFTFQGFSQKKQFRDIIGSWKVTGEQTSGASLEIMDSTDILFIYQGEKKKILNYNIDFSKSPAWFDFSINNDTASVVKVKSIMEVVNDNMIKWQLFIDEDRPDHFSTGKGELFYLIKEKPNVSPVSLNSKGQ
jgi:hypothetical protein